MRYVYRHFKRSRENRVRISRLPEIKRHHERGKVLDGTRPTRDAGFTAYL